MKKNQPKGESVTRAYQKIVIPEAPPQQDAPKKTERSAARTRTGSQTTRTTRARQTTGKPGRPRKVRSSPVINIVPLGGIEEIGKNMTLFECGDDMIIVDCGLGFPDYELYGIDIVIPDFSYVLENKDKVRALVITHGHEDHIGAVPYFLKQLNIPIYGTRLTLGLIEAKLKEHDLGKVDLRLMEVGKKLTFGCFEIEPINVNHSIPDCVALAISTPAGMVLHTGDFKVDYTPVLDEVINLGRFAEIGSEGVLLLLSDSTNAGKYGSSMSERTVGEGFEKLISKAEGKRLIIASFASNIQRVQQIIDMAVRHKRKIAISGRSMLNYTEMAANLGYLRLPDEVLIELSELNRYRPEDVVIVTTGSQGEPMSALARMANDTHKQIAISNNDLIIISATPVPGNEKMVIKVIDALMKHGCEVIYESMYEVHASGHACRDDLKLMMSLLKPKYFIPVHGEFHHLVKHRDIALSMGIEATNIMLPSIGQTIEVSQDKIRRGALVPAGRVLVDGLGVGDVGSIVLRDRKHLSQDGLMVVVCSIDNETNEIISGPDIISRGFVFVKEAEDLLDEGRELVREIIEKAIVMKKGSDYSGVKLAIREELGRLMYRRTKRNPMILPIIMEI